jgi:hypothetical protein
MQTRLDRLWQASADAPEDDRVRAAFYEGVAAARLYLALDASEGERVRPTLLTLEDGPVALAFDTEERFAAAIGQATDYAAMLGSTLIPLLASEGLGLALNPGAAPSETVLDRATLAWIAETLAVQPETAEIAPGATILPPACPPEDLLVALGERIAEFGPAVSEAWLVSVREPGADPDRGVSHVLIVSLGPEGADLADPVAAALTRTGQIASASPFAVAIAGDGARLLAAARRVGVGLSPSVAPPG